MLTDLAAGPRTCAELVVAQRKLWRVPEVHRFAWNQLNRGRGDICMALLVVGKEYPFLLICSWCDEHHDQTVHYLIDQAGHIGDQSLGGAG